MSEANSAQPGFRGHLPVLDGVRGLAIGMVLLLHFVGDATDTTPFEHLVKFVFGWGAYGVDLFFVLSGFLITGILCDSRGQPDFFRNFYMRRSLRIFPLYYAVAALTILVLPLVWPRASVPLAELHERQAWVWLYGTNILDAIRGHFSFPYLDHFWSLAVEEHFYAVWPFLVFFIPPKWMLRVALLVSLGASGLRLWASLAGVDQLAVYVLTPFRLDALALGGFVAILSRQQGGVEKLRRLLAPVTLVAGLLLFSTFLLNRFIPVGLLWFRPLRSTLITLLLTCGLVHVLLAGTEAAEVKLLNQGWLRFLGKYSYGMYVFHHFFSYWFTLHQTEFSLGDRIGSHGLAVLLLAAVGISGSLVVAMLSYRFFEEPLLKLKKYFPSSRAAG